MKFRRFLLAISLILYFTATSAAETPVGLVKTKPAEGRFVETERGFMVPYSLKIPGTPVTFEMVPIPGGKLLMGSPSGEADRSPDEGPQVEVKVAPFWMGKFEVTWAEYKEYMNLYGVFKEFASQRVRQVTEDNTADVITAPTELYDPSFTFEFGENPRLPAVTMTQFAARQYTKWLSKVAGHHYRLPSEAEWEYACRAGTTTAYHFGDDPADLAEYAWHFDNAEDMPHHVGGKKPNPWGLYDMHGNVWEWVLDEYREDGYKSLAGKTLPALETVSWPTKVFPRVVRGGSWDDDPDRCRAAAKMASHDTDWKSFDPNLPLSPWWFTSDPARGVGFRLLRPLNELPEKQMARFWDADVQDIKDDVQNRLLEGRGVLGIVDDTLPGAIEKLKSR